MLAKGVMMRFIVHAKMPIEPFNSMVRDGSVGAKIKSILEDLKPEAVYFTEYGGQRGALMIVDLKDSSEVPRVRGAVFPRVRRQSRVSRRDDSGRAGARRIGRPRQEMGLVLNRI